VCAWGAAAGGVAHRVGWCAATVGGEGEGWWGGGRLALFRVGVVSGMVALV